MIKNKWARGFLFVILGIGAVIIFGYVVMLLWNALLPDIINVSRINFWQALGILVLSKILFGGFGGGHGGKKGGYKWKARMEEKWSAMTPEEKEKFKQEWRSRCGPWKSFIDEKNRTNPSTQSSDYGNPGISNEPA